MQVVEVPQDVGVGILLVGSEPGLATLVGLLRSAGDLEAVGSRKPRCDAHAAAELDELVVGV